MEEVNCSICLENIYDSSYIYMLDECKHIYHYNCIHEYVEKLKYESLLYCPLCRCNFKTIGFTRIDLSLLFDKDRLEKNNLFNILPRECFVYDNLPISKKLSEFLQIPNNCLVSRYLIVKKIYKYIKDNNLNDENNKKIVNYDEKLKNLFYNDIENKDDNKISYIDIQKYLCNHIGYKN